MAFTFSSQACMYISLTAFFIIVCSIPASSAQGASYSVSPTSTTAITTNLTSTLDSNETTAIPNTNVNLNSTFWGNLTDTDTSGLSQNALIAIATSGAVVGVAIVIVIIVLVYKKGCYGRRSAIIVPHQRFGEQSTNGNGGQNPSVPVNQADGV